MSPGSYIVVTPARNEQDHLAGTIQSMARQTVLPKVWAIVNDGSTDRTGEIIDAAARDYSWISAVHRNDRGFRQQGAGVVEAFYDGLARVQSEPWEFLVKLDADLSFEPDYFERCLRKFVESPRLGIGGGLICQQVANRLVCESGGDPAFHVRGATKIYRRACWEVVGGLMSAPGWDAIDELKANMLGWETRSFKDIPLQHQRYTGTADGTWNNYVKFGFANYVTGYHPLFMALKCLKRIFERPYLVGAVALAWGFVKGYLTNAPRVEDRKLIKYVRRQQMNRLLRRPSLWDGTTSEFLQT